MARKALIGILAASLFGCGDGCRDALKKMEETPLSSEHMPTMVSENRENQKAASIIAPQVYALAFAVKQADGQGAGTQDAEEPNAITAPIEEMISYYEANESPSISFRVRRKITLNTEYERGKKAGCKAYRARACQCNLCKGMG